MAPATIPRSMGKTTFGRNMPQLALQRKISKRIGYRASLCGANKISRTLRCCDLWCQQGLPQCDLRRTSEVSGVQFLGHPPSLAGSKPFNPLVLQHFWAGFQACSWSNFRKSTRLRFEHVCSKNWLFRSLSFLFLWVR